MANPNQHQIADPVVRFRMHTEPDPAATKKAGRPIWKEYEVVEIRFPANKQTVHVAPAHEVFKQAKDEYGEMMPVTYAIEYAEQYRKFKANEIQDQSGTPLSELPFMTQAKRLEMKALNIHTAEQLAALDGQPLKMLGMGGRELKNQAQAFLDLAAGSADVTKLAADNVDLRAQIADMRKEMQDMIAAFKGGVPPAEANDDPPPPEGKGAFDDFTDADLLNWIKETDPSAKVDRRTSRANLIAKAEEVNAALAASKAKAA